MNVYETKEFIIGSSVTLFIIVILLVVLAVTFLKYRVILIFCSKRMHLPVTNFLTGETERF